MMRIAVCVKWVADLDSVDVDPLTGQVDRSRLLYVLDPGAESALDLALSLKAEVVALTVDLQDDALRIALAAGAGKVIRLEAEPRPAVTAALLAAAIATEGPFDRVLLGTRSADRGSGEVPGLLAATLGLPLATDVASMTGNVVERELEDGARETVRLTGPAVVALRAGVSRLPTASLPSVMKARRATIDVRRLRVRTLPTDPIIRSRIELPPRPRVKPVPIPGGSPDDRLFALARGAQGSRTRGRILEGPPAEMAEAILQFLRERGIVSSAK